MSRTSRGEGFFGARKDLSNWTHKMVHGYVDNIVSLNVWSVSGVGVDVLRSGLCVFFTD